MCSWAGGRARTNTHDPSFLEMTIVSFQSSPYNSKSIMGPDFETPMTFHQYNRTASRTEAQEEITRGPVGRVGPPTPKGPKTCRQPYFLVQTSLSKRSSFN